MKLQRTLLAVIVPLFLLAAPLMTYAADGAFYGPIVPKECNCPGTAASFGCVLATIQNVINFAVTIGFVAMTLALVFAGYTWMVSGSNPEKRSQGRGMLINVVIGMVILLGAWLFVDFAMKQLYNDGSPYGPWNSILQGKADDQCIKETKPGAIGTPLGGLAQGVLGGTDNQTASSSTPKPVQQGTGANCPVPPQSSMTAFPSSVVVGGTGLATPTTVQNFMAMRAAALAAGFDLKVSSAYRSDASQVSLWNQYCSSGTCGATKVAKPCSLGGNGSNHNSGQALDITDGCHNGQSGCNTAAYRWLKANGWKWSFKNELPTDPVHFSPSGR